MRVMIRGKVISRTHHKAADGSERYNIVIEEPGQYPSRFQLTSKLASAFGPPDGFAAVGKTVTATAFCNGAEQDAKDKAGKPFKAYRVWFTLIDLADGSDSAAPAAAPAKEPADNPDDDIPY